MVKDKKTPEKQDSQTSTINTTENVGEQPKRQDTKQADTSEKSKSPENDIYFAYVNGKNVATIAEEFKKDPQEVLRVIKEAEQARG